MTATTRLILAGTLAGLAAFAQHQPAPDLPWTASLLLHTSDTLDSTPVAGKRARAPLRVRVTDARGAPVPGALVCFHLPANGPGGQFPGKLQTEIVRTDQDGFAQAARVLWYSQPGTAKLRVIAAKGDLRSEVDVPLDILPASPGGELSRTGGRRRIWAIATVTAASVAASLGWAGK